MREGVQILPCNSLLVGTVLYLPRPVVGVVPLFCWPCWRIVPNKRLLTLSDSGVSALQRGLPFSPLQKGLFARGRAHWQ